MEHALTDSVIAETVKLAQNDVRLARSLLFQAAAKMVVSDMHRAITGPINILNYVDEFIDAIRNAHATRP